MKDLLVEPPSMTVVSRHGAAQANRNLLVASPWAMILAIIESKSAGIRSPSPTPVSTRMPGPARELEGADASRARGRNPRSGPRR